MLKTEKVIKIISDYDWSFEVATDSDIGCIEVKYSEYGTCVGSITISPESVQELVKAILDCATELNNKI